MKRQLSRCFWANPDNPLYLAYHDEEWGEPCHDERMLFEMLILEGFQAGLSWECVLNKRGMKFVGSTIIYSYLQAIGVINGHLEGCFKYKKL